jgi:hypothetical protein
MAFGQNQNLSHTGPEYLRDYQHASRVFRSNAYANAPRFKFSFHVYFTLNIVDIPPLQNIFGTNQSTIGLLVKTIQLPQYQIQTDVLNQYNRKRIVQKKIEYQPIQIEFHDDGNDLIRTLWYNYYSYYYKDPSQQYGNQSNTNGALGVNSNTPAGFNYNNRDIYANDRSVNDWGFIGESYSDGTSSADGKPPFFRDIRIYGFNQHKYAEYVLINPIITTWNHDTYNYSEDGGIMNNTTTITYETVKYYAGGIGTQRPDENVIGFADPNAYDQGPSPLSTPGGTSQITGQGGQLQMGQGQRQDLSTGTVVNPVGAVQTANIQTQQRNTAQQQLVVPNSSQLRTNTLQSDLPGAARPQPNSSGTGINFPTPPRQFNPTTGELGPSPGSDLPISA